MRAGPVALVGSGEFLAAMTAVDVGLLRGRPRRVAVVPTAATLEGPDRVGWWLELARRHYEAMGVEAVAVAAGTRAEADDAEVAGRVTGVGLVYLSGGDPHHLAATLRGSRLWEAIEAAWRGGAALAGCSAGAMALTAGAPPDLGPGGSRRSETAAAGGAGLGAVAGLCVIPHFDRLERRGPGVLRWFADWRPPGTVLVGIEEETALVGGPKRWTVEGRREVVVFGSDPPRRFGAGAVVEIATDEPGQE